MYVIKLLINGPSPVAPDTSGKGVRQEQILGIMATYGTAATDERPESDSGSDAGKVSLFPRRKMGGSAPSKHRAPVKLDYQTLESLFEIPQPDAARELGIALTTLKHACRRLGVRRWPYSRKRAVRSASGAADEHCRSDSSFSRSNVELTFESPRERDEHDMKIERNVKRKTLPFGSHDDASMEREVSMEHLSSDSNPEVYDRRHDPVIDDPFAADALNQDRAIGFARCPAAAGRDPAAGVGATGLTAQLGADHRIGGWAVPSNLWLVPDEVTKEAERSSRFWSLGPLEVASVDLDALARSTVSAIDVEPM